MYMPCVFSFFYPGNGPFPGRISAFLSVVALGRQNSHFPCTLQGNDYICIRKPSGGNSSVGRASASQAEGRGFDSRFPLNQGRRCSQNIYGFVVPIKPIVSKFHQHHIETLYHYGKIKSIFHRPEDKTRSRPHDQDDTPCQGSRNREH